MGVTTEFIRAEIRAGVLPAEEIVVNGRAIIRIHKAAFNAYLAQRGWKTPLE
jgi:hypothetical protein